MQQEKNGSTKSTNLQVKKVQIYCAYVGEAYQVSDQSIQIC